MQLPEQLRYQIGISLIPKIGTAHAKKLIAYLGSAEAVFNEKPSALEKIPGIGSYLAGQISSSSVLGRADDEIKFIQDNQINFLYYHDENFPYRLKECEDGPLVIFYKGEPDFNARKIISIVGTRRPTAYGKQMVRELIYGLQERGHTPIIVSGLAFGIDIQAHKFSLECNFPTLGILAHGLDRIYPPEHKETARQMVKHGALVTEFLSYTNPDPQNFVKRNRIIAGLSDATIVVESGPKGGSLITADLANSYNRDVFAFPGRARDEMSLGCNGLIAENKAMMVRDAEDFEQAMGWQIQSDKKIIQTKLFNELTDQEKLVVEKLREQNDIQVDSLAMKVNFPISMLNAILLQMEFSGILQVLPGKIIRLI